jgi:hypothetical protein
MEISSEMEKEVAQPNVSSQLATSMFVNGEDPLSHYISDGG